MMGDNVAQKLIFGNFSMYNKTWVKSPEMVALMHNVYCSGYVGGAGSSVWDPLNENHMSDYTDSRMECDAFVTMGPMCDTMSSQQNTSWRSITGVCPSSLCAKSEVNDMLYYPGCKAISNFWHWMTNAKEYGRGAGQEYRMVTDTLERKQNVLCFQEAQFKWDLSKGAYTKVVLDKGHWGSDIDTGLRAVMDGTKNLISPARYNGGMRTELF